MKKTTILAAALALLLSAPAPAQAKDPTAEEVVKKSWTTSKLDGSEMISTLIIKNKKGDKRVRKTAAVSKLYDGGKTEKRLIRFLSPADVKGTGLLSYDYEDKDDDIWFFLPSLRKTRRIVSSEKSKAFMGSEFTYADMTPPSVEDFKYKMLGAEKADGVDCWKIEGTPKDDATRKEVGYSKRVAWIAKKDNVVRKAETYDLRGKKHRELTATGIKKIEGTADRYRPTKMESKNVQNGRSSVMKIKKLKLRADIPDKYFTTRYLERF